MPHDHPGVHLLLLSGLAIYWLIPLSSWWMLRGDGNRNARLWFLGTGLYSLVATLFVFGKWLPPLMAAPLMASLGLLSVFMMLASLQREVPRVKAIPYRGYWAGAVLEYVLMSALYVGQVALPHMYALHLGLISLAEIALIVQANRVRQQHQSQAMWILIATFMAFALTNLVRVMELLLTGHFSSLLDFTVTSNASLIVNYLSVIFYCYGYWGFVVEKSRRQLVLATKETVQAQANERLALHREELSQDLLRERMKWMEQLTAIGKLAQSGALSATIAHEVNQPLAAIQLNIEESQRMAQDSQAPAPMQQLLKRIEHDNQRVAQIVQRVRWMFSGQPSPMQSQILDDLVQVVLQLHAQRLSREQVQLHLDLQAKRPFQFAPGEIEHVLMNLLDNALDALQSVPSQARHITLHTWCETNTLCLSVADNGPGIPEALRDSIFELLGTSKTTGMGVGLWLARYIAERHGGTLILDEHNTTGARFVLRIPQRPLTDAPILRTKD